MPRFSADDYLKTFINWEARLPQLAAGAEAAFELGRMERLLAVMGRPDEKLMFAHVAGTKGKGSACALLASILRACGHRVGLYTSPHLHALSERIRVLEPLKATARKARRPDALMQEGAIPYDELEKILNYFRRDIDDLRQAGDEITFYELMTAVAAYYFAQREVAVVVLETGLGGRLDATNVFETSVVGLTPIGYDHVTILGETIDAIAAEKAGVIKSPQQRVSLSPQAAPALEVITKRCFRFGITPTQVGRDLPCLIQEVGLERTVFDVEGRRRYEGLVSPLTGAHQAQNAALAIAMAEDLETFGIVISEEGVREGVAAVAWPARFERVASRPLTIIDAAHTVESARAMAETVRMACPGKRAVMVVGMSSDKDAVAFIRALVPLARAVVLTRANNPRAMDFSSSEIRRLVKGADLSVSGSVPEALEKARRLCQGDDIIIVTGSVFVCAEAREVLIKL